MAARRSPSKAFLKRLRRRPGHLTVVGALTLCAVLLLRTTCEPSLPFAVERLPDGALKGVTVVIDPGHGGADPGAVRGELHEAMLTYRMARVLADVLKEAGASVRFTVRSKALAAREGTPLIAPRDAAPEVAPLRRLRAGREQTEDLYARADLAARVWDSAPKKDPKKFFFLALHFDVGEPHFASGGHVCYDRRASEAPRIARAIARRWEKTGLRGSRPPAPVPRSLGVLKPERNPIPERVLVEIATISHEEDRAWALKPRWREGVARTLAAAIAEAAGKR